MIDRAAYGPLAKLFALVLVVGVVLALRLAMPEAGARVARAPVSFHASVSPTTVRVPKTRVIRHSLRITNRSSEPRRFAVGIIPPRFGDVEGSVLRLLSYRLKGSGKLIGGGSTIGDLPFCSSSRAQAPHGLGLYAEDVRVRVPARARTTIVAAFERTVRPSRATDLRVRWRVRGRGRTRTFRSRKLRIAGRPSAGIDFSTSPATPGFGEEGPDTSVAADQALTLSGRVHAGVPHYSVKLFYANDEGGSPPPIKLIAGLRSDSSGAFVYRWQPPLPRGRLEIWAEVPSTRRAAGDFACPRFVTVKSP